MWGVQARSRCTGPHGVSHPPIPLQGLWARVRMDDAELSNWFEVAQRLPRPSVMSPLVFIIFFAAVLDIVLKPFSEDDAILNNLYTSGRARRDEG